MKKYYIITLLGVLSSALYWQNNLICSESISVTQPALSSEEIVSRLLEERTNEVHNRLAELRHKAQIDPDNLPILESFMKAAESGLEGDKKNWPFWEKVLDQIDAVWPVYPVSGGLTFFMTKEEMKKAVTDKFKKMLQNGQIISKADFEKNYNKNEWVNKENNLTRIWGADYLASLGKNVPKYILVVDDVDSLDIQIVVDRWGPVLSLIMNGTVYGEKIYGDRVAHMARPFTLPGIGGYTDYSDPGNILKTADGKLYYVDTEYKSFYDGTPTEFFEKVDKNSQAIRDFLERRFYLLNNAYIIPMTINLTSAEKNTQG